jgi:hypothetical protein
MPPPWQENAEGQMYKEAVEEAIDAEAMGPGRRGRPSTIFPSRSPWVDTGGDVKKSLTKV